MPILRTSSISFLDMDNSSKDCVRSGAVKVHHGLGSFSLFTAPLEDAVHLLLGVDLNFFQTLNNHNPLLVSVLLRSQDVSSTAKRRSKVVPKSFGHT